MPSFVAHQIGTERNDMHLSRFSDFGVLEQSMEFRTEDATDLSRNLVFNSKSSGPAIASDPLQFGSLAKKVRQPDLVSLPSGHFENWGESTMADGSPRTDTSTDIEADDRNQRVHVTSTHRPPTAWMVYVFCLKELQNCVFMVEGRE